MAKVKKTFREACHEIIFGTEHSSRSQIRFWFYGVSLFILLCIVCYAKSFACAPPEPSLITRDVKSSKNIVVARVTQKTPLKSEHGAKRFRYRMEVIRNLKGKMKGHFDIDLDAYETGNCGVDLVVGSTLLNCLGTKPYAGGCGGFFGSADESDSSYREVMKVLSGKKVQSQVITY